MKFTDISYFASNSPSTGHYWHHEALKQYLGSSNYELFSRGIGRERGAKLSSLGYESGAGKVTSLLAKSEARKILRFSNFVENENQILFFYEGGAFEFQLCLELSRNMNSGIIWFNFHDSVFWADACREPTKFSGLRESLSDPAVRKRVVFSAESTELSTMLSGTFDFPCRAFTLYTTLAQQLDNISALIKTEWNKRQVDLLVIVGDFEMAPKVEKYVDVANSALGPDASIHIHWSGRDFELVKQLRYPSVTESFGQISSEEYALQLANSRFTLLLYPKHRYEFKSSGRIEDAVLLGSVPIVPARTSLVGQNSRSLPSFESPDDLLEILSTSSSPQLKAVDAEAFFRELFTTTSKHRRMHASKMSSRQRVRNLRFPNPIRRRRLVDKISIWRVRIGIPDAAVAAPRSLYRHARKFFSRFLK